MISDRELERVVAAARTVPAAQESYMETDFVMNLLETVIDYQMNTTAVVRALRHFRDHRWDELRTADDLNEVLERFPNDQEGPLSI